jgi:probable F420-dependent oxidoreductase
VLTLGLLTPVQNLSRGKYAEWEVDGTISDIARIAQAADRLGYEYLTCSEHVAIPVEVPTGPGPGPRYWDSLSTFGYLAAITTRIRFTTLVLVLPYHHPLDIAKRYGTLDRICGGRVNLGVGVGYLRPEFDLLGANFDERNERSDDAIRALRTSFGRREPTYKGTYFEYAGMIIDPHGVQTDVPIWVGGQTRRSLRRAIELGDVWCPFSLATEQVAGWLTEAKAKEQWHARGRPLGVALSTILDPMGAPDQTADTMGELREAGATKLTLRFVNHSLEQYLEQLEAMVEVAKKA